MFGALFWIFCMPGIEKNNKGSENVFTIKLGDQIVGVVNDEDMIDECLIEARRTLQNSQDEIYLSDATLSVEKSHKIIQKVDDKKDVIENMISVLEDKKIDSLEKSYAIKINSYLVNVGSKDDVIDILNAAIDKYDEDDEFTAELILDPDREVNVLTANVVTNTQVQLQEEKESNPLTGYGISEYLDEAFDSFSGLDDDDMEFDDYILGVKSLEFGDKVEIVEAYLDSDEITSKDEAIEQVTKDQEKNEIYEVKSGDTLGTIAENYDLSLDELVAMNETLDDENSIIRVGDELIVTVPKPELTILRTELQYYEEDYSAEVQYIDNDSWYTTKSVVLQEPSDGHHKVIVMASYENDSKVFTETVKEEVTCEAVPKIIERGTIVPPTYIKPISGGRLSSTFGYRSRPTKGASTYHKGVDWATPVGTAVMASSGGTVTRAGWASGYGYVIYIDHADGRQTRYGHLSKILVSVGDTVSQGEKIALSGNTGVSTGAHLHFEILIGGSQVNPLNYLN